ncbi:MAG: hypothetical protein RLZ62_1500 [Bacteroidota bacterium]|jgi:hypothetical protein
MKLKLFLPFFLLLTIRAAAQQDCHIYDLTANVVEFDDSTCQFYVKLNFLHSGNSDFYKVSGNGVSYGTHTYAEVPLILGPFQAGSVPTTFEFAVKDSLYQDCFDVAGLVAAPCGGHSCSITNLHAEVAGECNPATGTYPLVVNFTPVNPGNGFFNVGTASQFIGTFPLSQLPLTIPNFPASGNPYDVLKVCINDHPDCCAVTEFMAPPCNEEPCEITAVQVETGDCNGDSTYHLWVNFQVVNPPSSQFSLWGNGIFIGNYNLSQLPLHIPDFNWDGQGPNDFIKICMTGSNTGVTNCCKFREFAIPDCLLNPSEPCNIYDVNAIRTACLCGQFFVAVTFGYKNPGTGGFDIVGSGINFGNFPYSTPQPILLGPLQGNGTTYYEFVVRDHHNPACRDYDEMGVVECETPVSDPFSGHTMSISPNPAADWISVAVTSDQHSISGQATAAVYQSDGRLVREVTISDMSNFRLQVSDLASGVYRLSVTGASGRYESNFARQ